MNYKPEESTYISYVYGELTGEAKSRFERYLSENPEARDELQEIKAILGLISGVKDDEIEAPAMIMVPEREKRKIHPWVPKVLSGIAASLSLLIVAAIFNFSVNVHAGGIQMSFGKPSNYVTPEELKKAVEERPAKTFAISNPPINKDSLSRLIDHKLSLLEKKVKKNQSKMSDEEVEALIDKIGEENKEIITDALTIYQLEQQKALSNTLNDFAYQVQLQREEDLKMIRDGLVSIKDNTDKKFDATGHAITEILQAMK